jgi:hypothetical protein
MDMENVIMTKMRDYDPYTRVLSFRRCLLVSSLLKAMERSHNTWSPCRKHRETELEKADCNARYALLTILMKDIPS